MKYFTVDKDTRHNEDSEPYVDEQMIVVCDGLGGAGQNKHRIGDRTHTSAYYGARLVSYYTRQYFKAHEIWYDIPGEVKAFKAYLKEKLQAFVSDHHFRKMIGGKGAKLLPTTLAAAMYRVRKDHVDVVVLWAGDSRIYTLNHQEGLSQLTIDDVDGAFDAMDVLGNAAMNNCITGEAEDFTLHYATYALPRRPDMMLIGMSDGCFDYLATPMDLEFIIENALSALEDTADLTAIGEMLESFYQDDVIKDDTTMAGVICDDTDVRQAKARYAARYERINEMYRQPTSDAYQVLDDEQTYVNEHMVALNKGLRDLSGELVDYLYDVLNDKGNLESWPLRKEIMNLSSMAYLKDAEEKQYASRVAQQQKLKQLHDAFDVLYIDFVNAFSASWLKAHPDIREKEETTLHMQRPLDEAHVREITEQDIIASLRAQGILDEEIKAFLRSRETHGGDQQLAKMRDQLFVLRTDILKVQEQLEQPGDMTARHRSYLHDHRHDIVRDVMANEAMIAMLSEDGPEGVRSYADIYREQEKHKQKIVHTQAELETLWRDTYKETYELYRHSLSGGDV